MIQNLKYYISSDGETISGDVVKRGRYITTCVINVHRFLAGRNVFPCGNGDDLNISSDRTRIVEWLRKQRN